MVRAAVAAAGKDVRIVELDPASVAGLRLVDGEDLTGPDRPFEGPLGIRPETPHLILYTSGTTGDPKAR